MEQKQIDRINTLYRLSKERELTAEEKEEQQALRRAYIDSYRRSLTDILDNSSILRPDGTKEPVKRKKQ
ncbi:MAG: DUF896 domain-containing protein [Clostridia bacterium]|nr:DUF896 domain-containing protein [Clostridia bacterium]